MTTGLAKDDLSNVDMAAALAALGAAKDDLSNVDPATGLAALGAAAAAAVQLSDQATAETGAGCM